MGWLELRPVPRRSRGRRLVPVRAGSIGRAVGVARSDGQPRGCGRRARGKVRRYCAANRLNRLGTLTYRARAAMTRRSSGMTLARSSGGSGRRSASAFPYLWVPEWHKGGHGLHVHFAVGRFVARGAIERAWGRGFVHIKLLSDLPTGSGSLGEARLAARYLSKYVGKDLGAAAAGGAPPVRGRPGLPASSGRPRWHQRPTRCSAGPRRSWTGRRVRLAVARTRRAGPGRRRCGRRGTEATDPAVVRAWVERTRPAQGLPGELDDPVVIARVVALLPQARQTGSMRSGSKVGPAGDGRPDHGPVQEWPTRSTLTVEREVVHVCAQRARRCPRTGRSRRSGTSG